MSRTAPLPVKVAGQEAILVGREVDELVAAVRELQRSLAAHVRRQGSSASHVTVAQLGELDALVRALETASPRPFDPPLRLTPAQVTLVRRVLADSTGYRRRELSPGLLELRRLLAAPLPARRSPATVAS